MTEQRSDPAGLLIDRVSKDLGGRTIVDDLRSRGARRAS